MIALQNLNQHMPQAPSTFVDDVDGLLQLLWIVSGFVLAAVVIVIVTAMFKWRRTSSDELPVAEGSGSARLQIVAVTLFLAVGAILFACGWPIGLDMAVAPANSLRYEVTVKQSEWRVTYPDGSEATNEIYVPLGEDVRIDLTSEDVAHSFYVPAFRVSQKVRPGDTRSVWFRATQRGAFELHCGGDCGVAHPDMIGKIHVIGPDEIEERPWVKISGDNAAGQRLYMKWCIACHTLDGNKLVGPSFKGLFGREEEMKDGEKITVDEAYVIESIKEPSAKIVKGFETQPMLKLPLDDAEIASLVEFLKSEELK